MSILAKILATKREEIEHSSRRVSRRALEEQIAKLGADPDHGAVRPFAAALRRAGSEPIRVIAEFKRASPSAGAICAGAEIEPIVTAYRRAGAAAISVLTDRTYFDGDPSFLLRARRTVNAPLLRKDFLIDPYQVVEAKALGADAVLLIVSALAGESLAELMACARECGLEALVEVHDESEAERALEIGASVIGVNHRNLATFEIDMSLTGRLRAVVPSDVVLVGESGIRTAVDAQRLRRDGADAILVGESLMRATDPGAALAEFLQ